MNAVLWRRVYQISCSPRCTDTTVLLGVNYNIPSLCFGASGAAMHGFNEYVDLESFGSAATIASGRR